MTEKELKIRGFELFATRERLNNDVAAIEKELQGVINGLETIAQRKNQKSKKDKK